MDVSTDMPATLRDRRRAQTSREIARAAMELFAEKGFDAATAEEIASRAGVSRATFFNYFPQKELILTVFAQARMERVQTLLEARAGLSLASLLDLFVAFAEENEQMAGQLRSVLPHVMLRPACQAVVQPMMGRVQQSLASALQKGGELRADANARVFAESFFSLYLVTMIQWAVHPDPPAGWHKKTMRQRLGQLIQLARKGAVA